MTKQKTRKELERDMKEIRIIFVIMIIGVLVLGFYGLYKGIRVEKLQDQLSDQEQEEKWICPILLEKGKYDFNSRGFLISPSGIEIKCSKVPVEEWKWNVTQIWRETMCEMALVHNDSFTIGILDCQEQVPIWTLEIGCDNMNIAREGIIEYREIHYLTFTDYKLYLEKIDYIKHIGNCEVLK